MSTPTLSRHTTHRQPNFVAPLSEREIGRQLYRQGKRLSACVTDDMTAGWLDAEIDFVCTEIKREAREARKAGL